MEMWPTEEPHLHDHDFGVAGTAVLVGLMGGEVSVRER
jgi:hypothetical protein